MIKASKTLNNIPINFLYKNAQSCAIMSLHKDASGLKGDSYGEAIYTRKNHTGQSERTTYQEHYVLS